MARWPGAIVAVTGLAVVALVCPGSAAGESGQPIGAAAVSRLVDAVGSAQELDPPDGTGPASAVVGIAGASGDGYWLATADGGVVDAGSAAGHGSLGDVVLDAPVVSIAATPTGHGYWLAAADGGIFTFGDATFAGSIPAVLPPGTDLDAPIVSIAATPTGQGYWLAAADGGIFTFGDATFAGSAVSGARTEPVVAVAASPAGGYWTLDGGGAIAAFGAAAPMEDADLDAPAVGLVVTSATGLRVAARSSTSGPELPAGGTAVFGGGRRLVAYYGGPQSPRLGVLGSAPIDDVARRLLDQARAYDLPGAPAMPVFELITVVATAAPGPDGVYSAPLPVDAVEGWLADARRHGAYLLLDLQPGRADFLSQAQRYEEVLRQPDVGLALDPEWRMGPGEVPGRELGSVDAVEVNAVSAWLDELVARWQLPEKLFVVHQFTFSMITDRARLLDRPNLAEVLHADGFGTPDLKESIYEQLVPGFHYVPGVKLFYALDRPLLGPTELYERLQPPPRYISYQ